MRARPRFRVATLEECAFYGGHKLPRGLLPPMMGGSGIAIDASTPVYKSVNNNSTNSQTSASFTPPSGSWLIVMYSDAFGASGIGKPTNSAGTVVWDAAAAVTEAANSCAASIWRAFVSVGAAMTVTVTPTTANQQDWGFGIAVVTGAAASQTGAQTQVATSASGTPSATINSLAGSNSLVVGCAANFTNSTVGTPGTNQTLTFNGHAFSLSDSVSGSAIWAQFDTRISLAAGSSDTINDTAPTGVDYSLVMLEILAATGATARQQQLMTMGVGS